VQLGQLEALQQRYPPTIFEVLGVSGIGIKTAAMLFEQYGIGSLEDLERAIDSGVLAEAPRMGPKTIDNIRRGILAYRGRMRRTPLPRAASFFMFGSLPSSIHFWTSRGSIPSKPRITSFC